MNPHVPGIEVRGVTFGYGGDLPALRDVSFSVAPGEFVALMGPNGSGKTTLIKILLRLLEPQSGAVLLDGKDIESLGEAELYQAVGMVFQNPCDQLFAPTVEEDVAFGPRNLKLGRDEVARRVGEALEAVEAAHLARRPIHHLSFGEQKRVCLAGALAMRPAVLLMDEPTAGMDPDCEQHMVGLLTQLNRQRGITILMASHAVDLMPLLAQSAILLSQGRLLARGMLEDVFGDPDLLGRAGLRMPLISQLFHGLLGAGPAACEKLPMTVEQGRQLLRDRLAGASERKNA